MLKVTIPAPRTSPTSPGSSYRVAIIGGGFTGATVARLLVERGWRQIDEIVIFEPRGQLGAGLAYDVQDPDLRLNVAAHRMRAVPGTPSAFLDWLQSSGTLSMDPDAIRGGGIYARRRDFGRFMYQQLCPFLEAGTIRHCGEAVIGIARRLGRWHVRGSRGTIVEADIVILATGHPGASMPKALARAAPLLDGLISDALSQGAFDAMQGEDSVLVIGSGLTALDALMRLNAKGHRGRIVLLSRSGLLPRPHSSGDFSPYGDFDEKPPRTALALLGKVRGTIAEAQDKGIPWQSVFDALRQQAQTLWQTLPQAEQRKLVRRLRRWYDVHRYRMPPQVGEQLEREIESGRVVTIKGEITAIRREASHLAITISNRAMKATTHMIDRIILATGPDFADYCTRQKWLLELGRAGAVCADPLGLGLACDRLGRAIGADGRPDGSLFIAGPPARAAVGELTGVPEIAAQASILVNTIIAQQLRKTRTFVITGRP